MNIYVTRDGQNYGPYPAEQAHAMIAQGQLALHDLACPEGSQQWVPLGQVLGIPPQGAAPQAAAPAMPVGAQSAPLQAARPAIPVAQPATAVPAPGQQTAPMGQAVGAQTGYATQSMAAQVALPPGVTPGTPTAMMAVKQLHKHVSTAFRNKGLGAFGVVIGIGIPILVHLLLKESTTQKGILGSLAKAAEKIGLTGGIIAGAVVLLLCGWWFLKSSKRAALLKGQFIATKAAAGFS